MTVIRTTRALLAGAAIAVAGTALAVAAPATAAPQHTNAVPAAGSYYLALGDSVPFGFREAQNSPTPDYTKATNFEGYPELVGKQLGLKVVNASCPGETSSSMVNITKQSNGCEANSSGVAQAGYRTNYPLHTDYDASQRVFAKNFLLAHPETKLVTLMIGANDGFICQQNTSDHCTTAGEITPVVQTIAKNVGLMMTTIRNQAHYTGKIIIVNYFSLDYSSTQNGGLQQAGASAINNGLDSGARPSGNPYDIQTASVYKAFQRAAAQSSGDDCAAGLLTILNGASTPCGVHPSVAGQNIIAGAVIQGLQK